MPDKTRRKTGATKAGVRNKQMLQAISKEMIKVRAWAKWVNHVIKVIRDEGPIGGVGQPPYPS
jgi:hypothetical protein